jgi:hypothetical protein
MRTRFKWIAPSASGLEAPVANSRSRTFSTIAVTGLGVCLVITALFAVAVFLPLWSHNAEAAIQARQLDLQKLKAAQLDQDVRDLKHSLAKTQLAMSMIPLKLESDDQLNNRLAGITTFSKQCGLEIGDILPGAASPGPRYETISIHMIGQGSYRACTEFLHRLHHNFLDTAVRGFRLMGSPQDPGGPISFEFDLVWFATPGSVARSE